MARFTALFAAFLALSRPAAAQQDRELVRVNGAPIRQSEIMERLWRRFGPQTMQEMIDELLLRQSAAAAKVKADPAEVEKRLKRLQSQLGDPKLFAVQLQQSGTTVEKVKEDIADALTREKLVVKERKLAVKDEELKKAFEDHRAELGTPLAVRLRHIKVKTEKEAFALAKRIKDGADFNALAREKSLAPTASAGGELGMVSKGMIPPDWEPVVFDMKPKEIRTLPTPSGVHVLQTLERREAAPAEFSKIKEDLRDALLAEKVQQALPTFLGELRAKAEIKPQGQ